MNNNNDTHFSEISINVYRNRHKLLNIGKQISKMKQANVEEIDYEIRT